MQHRPPPLSSTFTHLPPQGLWLLLAGGSFISHLFVLPAFLVSELPALWGTKIKRLQTPSVPLTRPTLWEVAPLKTSI